MPHGLLKSFKSQLPKFIAQQLGRIQAAIISKVNQKVNEILQQLLNECPPPPVLERISKTVTNLKSLFGKFDSKISRFKRIPPKLDPAIKAGKVVVEILSHMPLPSTIGLPPGPAGGVIFSVPTGIIQAQSNVLVFARDMVEKLEDDKKAMKSLFDSTDGTFDPIKSRIEQIERLLQRCAENPNLTDEERKRIMESVGGQRTKTDDTGESYTSINGKTYTLKIINDPTSPDIAPRRQAVAFDYRGIAVLKGPSSFAGDPQVLKDELKFRIDNQLP